MNRVSDVDLVFFFLSNEERRLCRLVSVVQCGLWMIVDWVPCWNDEGFELGGQVSSDHLFGRWYAQSCGHGVAGEGWLQHDQSTMHARVCVRNETKKTLAWNRNWKLKAWFDWFLNCQLKRLNFPKLPFKFSAYSVRSMFLAHRMNLWFVQTSGSVSICSHWCLLTASACCKKNTITKSRLRSLKKLLNLINFNKSQFWDRQSSWESSYY